MAGSAFVAELRATLADLAGADEPDPVDDLVWQVSAWSRAAAEPFVRLLDRADGDAGRRALVRRAALSCAPLCLQSGAWLQWLSAPGNADSPVVLRVLALYAADVGVGHPSASRGSAYLALLRRLLISQNAVPAGRLAGDPRIADAAFPLPAVLLAMSRRPDDFRSELLGADLCLRAVGLPPPAALVERAEPNAADWAAINPAGARRTDEPPALDRCRAVVADLLADGPESAHSVRLGFRWAQATVRAWTQELYAELEASLAPAHDMAQLLRLRAREGAVYHHQFLLEGRPLAAWLTECRADPLPLLDALARSRLVKPGRSEASSLVRGLVSERGPMFRIFSPDDLTTIRRWIDSLPAGPVAATAGAAERPAPTAVGGSDRDPHTGLAAALLAPAPAGEVPADLRAAYHQLITRTGNPALRAWCLDYVHGWLASCRHALERDAGHLPDTWTSEGLRPWLQAQHDRHGAEFARSTDVPLPSREAVIDDAVQTAPLTLIDGSWLQGFTDYEQASSDVGHPLFRTYWDELGNGEPHLNHPLLYRQVLAGMGVELPATASVEFARWPGFRDSSFELPVYWLCIGRFPRTFLPEVLGLNLAMELSGVGGTYRRAHMALRAYGFDTRFVDIHNTIDNIATGHSAWAADAIDTWLAAMPTTTGPGSRGQMWHRIRVGYQSLTPPRGAGARPARRGRIVWRRRGPDRPALHEPGTAPRTERGSDHR